MPEATRHAAVLFDLDGTLADTAPDLGRALNRLLAAHDKNALPLTTLRPHVSAGARGLIKIGFGLTPTDRHYTALQDQFLRFYEAELCVDSSLFEGMQAHLDELNARQIPWGVVTNKSQRFAIPLMEALGLRQNAACIVCGDSAPRAKPHAHPMKLAATLVNTQASQCIYVGDDQRDIVAGKAAGMTTVIAAWGYLGSESPPAEWGADAMATHPQHIVTAARAASSAPAHKEAVSPAPTFATVIPAAPGLTAACPDSSAPGDQAHS